MGTILAVYAHPDDEFVAGPLLARYAAEGHQVYLASITSGQLGSTPNLQVEKGEPLGRLREQELRCAARCLGIHEPFLLGFQDQGISSPSAEAEVTAALRALFVRVTPEVVLTFGPDGVSGHPDHRATSNLVTEVFGQRALLPHAPRKLYYAAVPESVSTPVPPPFRPGQLRPVSDALLTTVVDCRAGLDAASASLRCHRSQWDDERVAQFDFLNRRLLDGRIYLRPAFASTHHEREEDLFQDL